MMVKINYKILILIIMAVVLGLFTFNYQHIQNNEQINSFKAPEPQILGSNSKGNVIKSGPYGNPNSTQKIAFIVGVHPLEANSHKAMVTSILILSKSLNSHYYIYSIDVTKDRDSYDNGRMNGQILANEYAVPDIEKNNFNLVIDVHSNSGDYQEKRFISVPIADNRSQSIAYQIIYKIPWLVYYIPPIEKGPSSPDYVTVPLIHSRIPAIVYETYKYEPYELTVKHAVDFVRAVDSIKLN